MSVAKELIFTGRVLDGTEAHRIGLVNDVVDQNDDGDAAFHRSIEIAQLIVPNVSVFFHVKLTILKISCRSCL